MQQWNPSEIICQQKIKIEQWLKMCKSIIESILTYTMCTWGLTKAQVEQRGRTLRKQLRRVFNYPHKMNLQSYRDNKEKPLSATKKETRRQTLAFILWQENKTRRQETMKSYSRILNNTKKVFGHKRSTTPAILTENI